MTVLRCGGHAVGQSQLSEIPKVSKKGLLYARQPKRRTASYSKFHSIRLYVLGFILSLLDSHFYEVNHLINIALISYCENVNPNFKFGTNPS